MHLALEIGALFCMFIVCIITVLVGTKYLCNGRPLLKTSTFKTVKENLKEEKRIYNNIHNSIKEAGIIDRIIIKRKLGPLYNWYKMGVFKNEDS
jgi:hypothetical protein